MNHHIAIDGPAGAGKSTIAKKVAEKLGYLYIDTGAMYRAMGLFFNRSGVWPEESDDIAKSASLADITITYENGAQQVYLNGENVTRLIRTEECGMAASKVSIYPEVRKRLVALQQKIARTEDVVMDGRDIGTVVLPDALLKIFLTADVKERAGRRYLEMKQKGEDPDFTKIEEDLRRRDHQDSTRAASPLRQADDAVLVDSTNLSIDEVVGRIISLHNGCLERKNV